MMNHPPIQETIQELIKTIRWKQAGIAGFMFFFLKGLAWLAAPLALYLTQ